MVVGICHLDLRLREGRSLKAKRKILRSLIDRTRERFNAAVAEVGGNDLWQRAEIGVAVVGNDARHVQSMLDTIVRFVASSVVPGEVVRRDVEVIHAGASESWRPMVEWDEGDERDEDADEPEERE